MHTRRQVSLLAASVTLVALLFTLPFVLAFWDHGYAPSDDGWILAYAWRIWNGEVPFRDFIFIRPPLSLYLHTIWFVFPSNLQFSIARIGFYGQMLSVGAIFAFVALHLGGVKRSWLTPSVFGFFFVFSFHNFPPMPWHTVDGLLFSSLGLLFLGLAVKNNYRLTWVFVSGICFALAPLTKQNFLTMPAFFLASAAIVPLANRLTRRRRGIILAIGALSISLVWGLFFLYLYKNGAIAAFWSQMAAKTRIEDLWTPGVELYFKIFRYYPQSWIVGVLMVVLPVVLRRRGTFSAVASVVPVCLIAAQFIYLISKYAQGRVWTVGFEIFWLGAGIFVSQLIVACWRREKLVTPWFVMSFGILLLGWTVSISWGWNTPMLAVAGIGLLVARPLNETIKSRYPRTIATSLLSVLTILATLQVLKHYRDSPYQDLPRKNQNYNLAELFPKFNRLFTGEATFRRFERLRALSREVRARESARLVVIPEFPLLYFLEDRLNPAPIDWWFPSEYSGLESLAYEKTKAANPLIAVEIRRGSTECEPLQEIPTIWQWFSDGQHFVRRANGFCLYRLGDLRTDGKLS